MDSLEENLELIKNLIKDFDLDVNKKDKNGNTGFHNAFKVYAFGC